jgi:pilus assembly protein CpaB
MNRRLTGLVAAVALALVGTLVLVTYVKSAEARALSDDKLVTVLVVRDTIEAGTKAADIAEKVDAEQVPAKVKADGALTSLADIKDLGAQVATIDLLPGEQLVADRFGKAVEREGVPAGMLEVTVKLDPERALGGAITVGDKVAVVSSFEPFELDASGAPAGTDAPKKTPNMSHVILHHVLVTKVQMSTNDTGIGGHGNDGDTDAKAKAPSGVLLVTLAVDAPSLQQVVFTAEFGALWLSAEPDDVAATELPIETLGTVLGLGSVR